MSDFETHPVGTGKRISELEAEVKHLRVALENISVGIIPGINYDATGEPLSSLLSGYAMHILKEVE